MVKKMYYILCTGVTIIEGAFPTHSSGRRYWCHRMLITVVVISKLHTTQSLQGVVSVMGFSSNFMDFSIQYRQPTSFDNDA